MDRIIRNLKLAVICFGILTSFTLAAQTPALRSQALLQVNGSITSSVRSGVVFGPALRSALTSRSELMKEILRHDAASARSYALDDSTRSSILAADPSASELLEQDAIITGELVGAVADDFEHGTSTTIYSLHTFDRDLDLSFAVAIPGVDRLLHSQVTVHGISLSNILAAELMDRATPAEIEQCKSSSVMVSGSPGLEASAAPAVCSTTGLQHIAVLMVTFPGNSPAYPAGTDQPAYWDRALFGANPSVSGFWNEVSYGQTGATGDVFGPFALPQAYDCTTTGGLMTAAITAATGTVDFSQYNRIMIMFPVTSSCYFGGLAGIGCGGATSTIAHQYSIAWIPVFPNYTPSYPAIWGDLAHELGHNLGLGHASTLDFGSVSLGPLDFINSTSGTVHPSPPASGESDTASAPTPISSVSVEYGDFFSVMGNGWTNAGPYSSEHRIDILGWIPKTDLRDVTASGSYTLVPAENSTGLRGLHVLRDPISNSWLWLEFHQPIGYYTPNNIAGASGNTLANGAQLHYETGSLNSIYTYLLDMTPVGVSNNFLDGTLAPGTSWSDPYSLLTLSVGAQASTALGITVRYDTPCAAVSLSAPELAASGGTANLIINAPSTCSWSAYSNASWINIPGTSSGSGNATIPFTYDANTTSGQRNSYITAQRQSLPVVQDGPNVNILGVSPAEGSGSAQSFVTTISDAVGVSDLNYMEFFVGTCGVYAALTGTTTNSAVLYLFDSSGGPFMTGILPGSSGSSTIGKCTLYGQGSSVTFSGNQMIVTLNLTFSSSYTGMYPLRAFASTKSTGTNTSVGPLSLGLFFVTGGQTTSQPVISPSGGTYTSAQTVTITDATAGATIYYTTDGSGPTTSSTPYTGPISVSQTEAIEAIAIASGFSQSPVAAATFTITPGVPVFAPNGGTFTSIQTLAITDTTAGSTIYYTTDGTMPTTSSTKYTAPITVSQSGTIEAIATLPGLSQSAVASASFVINLPPAATPAISPLGGSFAVPQTVTITDATAGAVIYYTTDGTSPTTNSAQYTAPITVSQSETLKAMATAVGYSQSSIATAAFTIGTATPVISPNGGTYISSRTVTMTDATAGAKIYYTTDGSTPSTSSTQYTAAITVSQTETIKAFATSASLTPSTVASAVFTIIPATPVISPNGGTFTSIQTVTITDATAGSTIYYTTNGTTPTTSSTQYTAPIMVSQSEYVWAIATAPGLSQSNSVLATFTINLPAAAQPVILPAGGTYTTVQTITMTDSTVGAKIFYTTDGSTPTTSSAQYTAPFTISQSETVRAIATVTGYSQSPVTAVTYTINLTLAAQPVISPAGGTYTTIQTATITDTTTGATIYYTTDGSTPTANSTKYTAPLTVSQTLTVKAIATAAGYAQSPMTSATYTINLPVAATPVISPGGGTYTTSQTVTITDATGGATIFYTIDGSTPTSNSTPYTVPLTVSQPETVRAIATGTGYTQSAVAAASFTITPATPVIAPSGGTYTTIQTVTLTDSTAGSAIYYTTNGTTPTTSSTPYTVPITVPQSETIEAIATAPGLSQSAVATAVFTINLPVAATPVLSPPGGTFASAQTVSITDTTTGSAIYYTTDGSTPTVGSSKFSVPLTISANETVKAIAAANGYTTSSVASAQYIILVSTATTLKSSASTVTYGTTVTLTATVAPAAGTTVQTGSANFYDGSSLLASIPLSGGTAAYSSASLAIGQHTLTASYGGDAYDSSSTSPSVSVIVNAPPKTTPTVTVTPSSASITTAQPLTVTIAVSGGSGYPTATGTVALSSGTYVSATISLSNGSATISIPAGSLAVGADTLSALYTPDASASVYLNGNTGSAPVTVTTAPGFTITGANLTVSRGATTGNTSTITVTSVGGLTGSVALTAALTSSPAGTQYPPTLSFGSTSPVSITGTTAGTATLTISTTAATSAVLAYPKSPGIPWIASGGATLACIFLLGIPTRRRRWRSMLGLIVLLALLGGMLACGGKASSGGGGGISIPGTTAGTYTVTITGTSGATTATGVVTLTVQ